MIAINGGPAGTREELFTCLSRDGLPSVVLGWIDLGSFYLDGAGLGQETHAPVAVTEVGRELGDTHRSYAGPCSRARPARTTGSCSRTHLARTTGVTELLRGRYEDATKTLRVQTRSVGQTRSVFVALFGLVSVQFS